jgi:hypothetical protein
VYLTLKTAGFSPSRSDEKLLICWRRMQLSDSACYITEQGGNSEELIARDGCENNHECRCLQEVQALSHRFLIRTRVGFHFGNGMLPLRTTSLWLEKMVQRLKAAPDRQSGA